MLLVQRIAWRTALPALLIVVAGCESQQPRRLPEPPLSTGKRPVMPAPDPLPAPQPPPTRPIVRKPAPAPAPLAAAPRAPAPAPSAYRLDRAALTPRSGIRPNKWKVIVVHHSASPRSSPEAMQRDHVQNRGWDSLGYHFVIGNGIAYPDGKIYVGQRWHQQSHGAHCKASAGRYFGVMRPHNFFNNQGIGVCLIGNFQSEQPTTQQTAALQALSAFLCEETGISASAIYGHGQVTNGTECPGRYLTAKLPQLRSAVATAAAPEPGAWTLSGPYADNAPAADMQLNDSLLIAHQLGEVLDAGHWTIADAFDDIPDAESDPLVRATLRLIDHYDSARLLHHAGCGCGLIHES